MTTTSDLWADVAFDHRAAAEAADACTAAARRVAEVADARRGAAAIAVEQWEGGRRRQFDDALEATGRAGAAVAADLAALAARLRAAMAEAAREQRAREAWRADHPVAQARRH